MSDELDEIEQSDADCIDRALGVLKQHYDTCIVFAQRKDASNHGWHGNGDGLYGQVRRWLVQQEATMRLAVLDDQEDEDGDDE